MSLKHCLTHWGKTHFCPISEFGSKLVDFSAKIQIRDLACFRQFWNFFDKSWTFALVWLRLLWHVRFGVPSDLHEGWMHDNDYELRSRGKEGWRFFCLLPPLAAEDMCQKRQLHFYHSHGTLGIIVQKVYLW